ncbi:MAG: hypothetical protein ACOZNI_20335 [Myxococcota bacterium]
MILLWIACAGEGGDTAAACDPAVATWDGFGDGFFRTYCRACHSATAPDRHGAPEGVDFDTIDDVRAQRDAVRSAVIERGTMPLGGGVYDDDLARLDVLLACGLE